MYVCARTTRRQALAALNAAADATGTLRAAIDAAMASRDPAPLEETLGPAAKVLEMTWIIMIRRLNHYLVRLPCHPAINMLEMT